MGLQFIYNWFQNGWGRKRGETRCPGALKWSIIRLAIKNEVT
jgi:hypothetical protein